MKGTTGQRASRKKPKASVTKYSHVKPPAQPGRAGLRALMARSSGGECVAASALRTDGHNEADDLIYGVADGKRLSMTYLI